MSEEELMERYYELFDDCFPSMELIGIVDPITGMQKCIEENKSAEELYGPFDYDDGIEY